VLVVRAGGREPRLDDRSHNRSLFSSVEYPPLDLTRAKANDTTCHVRVRPGIQVCAGWHRFGIVERSNRLPQGSHGDAIAIPYGRAESAPQVNSQVVGWHEENLESSFWPAHGLV
jgi:hypothetical protein